MKRFDPAAVQPNELQVVQLLEQKMTRIIVDTRGWVVFDMFEEQLKSGSVIQI